MFLVTQTIQGSIAVARAAINSRVEVAACYPITPSTHVAEELARAHANGEIPCFISVESEFSALSALVGASAAGARSFTATSSQGLLLMHEVLFNASGMRLPIVVANANRAVSAPLNIWNDEQDSISQRDSGWIQFYCESNQEATDSIPIAFKAAEKTMLPAMVNVDGFNLTHAVEQINVPEKERISEFLPDYNPPVKLDTQNPLSLGVYATPPHYQSFRQDLEKDLNAAAAEVASTQKQFSELFGRNYELVESYKAEDAEAVIVGMGSVMANAKIAADEMRAKGVKAGVLRIRLYRPFPAKQVAEALHGKKAGVFEKCISPGGMPPLFAEVAAALGSNEVHSFTGGLGGRDVRVAHFKKMFEKIASQTPSRHWVE
ncbi:MAG: transketolase C-terminal domain-containing protein [Candidatus Micrarchaeia archaeon]